MSLSWASIVGKNTKPEVLTHHEQFRNKFLRYTKTTNVLGTSTYFLRLAISGPKEAPDVFTNSELMLLALKFDFKQTFPLVDPKIMTVDFLYEVYNIQNVKSLLIDYLPYHILGDNQLITELQERTNSEIVDLCNYKFSKGSFVGFVATILKGNCKIHCFKESIRFEKEFLKTLYLVRNNPLDFTIDKAFIMSLESSEQLTRKYQNDYEYRSFYDRIKHDIEFYNLMCRIQLYSKSAYRHFLEYNANSASLDLPLLDRPLGFLGYLCIQGQFSRKVTGQILDYIDEKSYGLEIGFSSLRQIAIHLGIHVVIHPKKE